MASIHASDVDTIQLHQNNVPSKVKLIIHHQFPGIKLVSPVHAGGGVTFYLLPDQNVDVGATTQAGFNIHPGREVSTGVLLYNLERKNGFNEDEETCIQLFMILNVYNSGEFYMISDLIEANRDHVWDEDGLMGLTDCYWPFYTEYGAIEETYLMHDSTVQLVKGDVTY
jgi:hypothetical protein